MLWCIRKNRKQTTRWIHPRDGTICQEQQNDITEEETQHQSITTNKMSYLKVLWRFLRRWKEVLGCPSYVKTERVEHLKHKLVSAEPGAVLRGAPTARRVLFAFWSRSAGKKGNLLPNLPAWRGLRFYSLCGLQNQHLLAAELQHRTTIQNTEPEPTEQADRTDKYSNVLHTNRTVTVEKRDFDCFIKSRECLFSTFRLEFRYFFVLSFLFLHKNRRTTVEQFWCEAPEIRR